MSTLEAIVAELQRQYKASDTCDGLGYFNADDTREAVIDGRVDLVALAKAVDMAVAKRI